MADTPNDPCNSFCHTLAVQGEPCEHLCTICYATLPGLPLGWWEVPLGVVIPKPLCDDCFEREETGNV